MFSLALTYEQVLMLCGFRNSPFSRGREREDVYPGVFLGYPNGATSLAPVSTTDTHTAIAVDRRFGGDLRNWADLCPMTRSFSTGSPRLDRISDLADIEHRYTAWIRENHADPFSGLLPQGQQSSAYGLTIAYWNGEAWCTRVPEPGYSDDPDYPHPLSVFGRLYCLHPLLREMGQALLRELGADPPLRALGRIVTMEGLPPVWTESKLEQLELVQGELHGVADRFAEASRAASSASRTVAEHAPSDEKVCASLSWIQRDVLVALYSRFRATDLNSPYRPTGPRLAKEAIGAQEADARFKEHVAGLKRLGLANNGVHLGAKAGYFLTERGARIAKMLTES